ncbi:MAG: carboxypeptidase-like regulatory domain-containing protein, partial [Muribaculaceae bacterium]|nr:carboxypeptidase-like regulatory domain-containing protein [Muribaculaceae bacterium]
MKKRLLSALMLVWIAFSAIAQTAIIHGTVLSKTDGEPLIGAIVSLKDGGAATDTDLDGKFEIKAAPGSKLVFSYMG